MAVDGSNTPLIPPEGAKPPRVQIEVYGFVRELGEDEPVPPGWLTVIEDMVIDDWTRKPADRTGESGPPDPEIHNR